MGELDERRERYELAVTMRKAGFTLREIGEELGISREGARKILVRGWPETPTGRPAGGIRTSGGLRLILERWRDERRAAGFSIEAIAEATGLPVGRLGAWERGNPPPSLEGFVAMLKSIGLTLRDVWPGGFSRGVKLTAICRRAGWQPSEVRAELRK